jgi:glutamine cyclotransferase
MPRHARVLFQAQMLVIASLLSACGGTASTTLPAETPSITSSLPTPLVPASLPAGTVGVDLGGETNGLTMCGRSLWAAAITTGEFIARVNPSTATVLGQVDGGVNLACFDGQPWAAVGDAVRHLDASTGAVLASVSLTNAYYVGVGAGSVWSPSGKDVVRIDPGTAKIVATIPVGAGFDVTEVDGSNDDAIWVTVKEANKVYRIDPAKNKVVAEIPAGAFAHGILVQSDAVWISNAHEGSVTRIDPKTNQPTAVQGPGSGVGLAEGAGFVWASTRGGDLYRIDPKTNAPTMVGHLDGWPYGIAFADNVLWVGDGKTAVYGIPIAAFLPSS